ncbi:MAG TPA: protein kinase, partial [Pyrinomonadaceae bacterium]|nr:protein kinase [Pyrinomonadaceae bacterium]
MSYSDHSIGGGNTRKPKMAPAKPEPKDPLINTVLDQRYLIESKLGHGGFGSVYLGADKKMISRKIVIKVMNSEEVSNDWSKKKFQQELEALARINHSSVVGVLDCGETPDARPYIVMQYIDGVSLRSLITPEGMSFCRASNIIKQVGKALSAAHQAGILHRDLKPENIMVHLNDDEEQVKVIDFGVAKVRNSIIDVSTAEGISVGTIAYMSPEQLTAKAVLPESDIYSMAVIAYEMLTGRRPNNPESAFQLLEMQRMGVRVKPSALRPSLNPKAEQILLKALSFSADDRYNRAREFGDVLSDALLTDYEQTLLPTQKMKESPVNEILDESSLQTAHVLFLDIVGYSRSLIDEQKKNLMHLQEIVGASDECKRATEAERFIALPTGDGMALVFFNEVEAPVRCAVELSRALRATPEIKLRMGIHSGLVYRMADI